MSRFHFPLRSDDFRAPADLSGLGGKGLIVGALAAAGTAAGAFVNTPQFFQSYLVAWLLWFMVAAGCLGLLLLHHLSGGVWGLMIRRPMEAGARTLPVVGLFALPLLFGLRHLFAWADHAKVEADHLLHHKAAYLNAPFFVARTVFAVALFSFFAYRLSGWSARQDRDGDAGKAVSMRRFSAVGLLVYVIVSSFLGFDWLMSLDAHYFSSLYGAIFLVGEGLSGLTFLILITRFLARREPMAGVYTKKNFHDYGKLLFAFVMFFTYLGISQFIITYQGNLPEEVVWYQERFHGGWGLVAAGLLVFHFFFPFLILLSRSVKQNARALAAVAGFVLVMRWVDLIWQSRPSFGHEGLALHWLDLVAPIAVGGLWLFFYARELAARPLLPVNDPYLKEALGHD
ncbi:MAG: hypothetical protein K8H90_08795 [Thermoanaerobaculia bacterium]|nr:hypothetical protein [Thermoanaerobaculia bacterium]